MRFSLNTPGSYNSSNKIGSEFENLARYLVAGERGNKTIPELLATIFDNDGEWAGPIEVRYDNDRGLEYRVGEYKTDDLGWILIAKPEDIRGAPGSNVGDLNAPMFYGRQSFTGDGGTTTFSYNHKNTDDLFVYDNGVLQATSTYTNDTDANTVTFNNAPNNGNNIEILRFRKDVVSGYRRSEITSVAGQVVFAFPHEPEETLKVFRNGILQRPGGSYDYTTSSDQDTISFTTGLNSGDLVTILTVENTTVTAVGGLMLEDEYAPDGAIPWSNLNVPDGSIAQAKVNGLPALLQDVRRVFVGSITPASSVDGDMWIDTSVTPVELKFRSAGSFYSTSPNVKVPAFSGSDSGLFLKVSATGQFLEYSAVDTTNLVPKTFIGASNGVAGLNGSGKVPVAQMPDTFALQSINFDQDSVANQAYTVKRLYGQQVRIDKIAALVGSGSCDIQLSVDGTAVGDKVSVGGSLALETLSSSVTIDATTTVKTLEIEVTNNSSAADLEVTLAAANITA